MRQGPYSIRKELSQPEARGSTPIAQHFALINQSLQHRVSLSSVDTSDQTFHQQKVVQLQQLFEQIVSKSSREKEVLRQRLKAAKQKIMQNSKVMREKVTKNREKIQSLKTTIQARLHQLQYLAEVSNTDIQRQFSAMLGNVTSLQQSPMLTQLLPSLHSSLVRIRKDIQSAKEALLGCQDQDQWIDCLTLLELKVKQFRQGMTSINSQCQEALSHLQGQVWAAQKEIEGQLSEQVKRRQYNKEKILTLLQNAQLPSKLGT